MTAGDARGPGGRGGARPLRAAAGAALALFAASCGPDLLVPGLLGPGHASFEEAAEDHPEIAEVSSEFDRLADPPPEAGERERQLDLFAEVFAMAREDYVEPVSPQTMALLALEGFEDAEERANGGGGAEAEEAENPLAPGALMRAGLSRMLGGLDPHSGYLPPDRYKEMQLRTRGEFGGIGIEVTMEDGLVKIVAPLDGTPGARAGLRTGDFIVGVNGTDIRGRPLSDSVRLMRGRAGTDVRLDIRRPPEDRTFAVRITRAVIEIEAVRARAEGNVGYLRVTTFNERAEDGVRRALRRLAREIDGEVGYVIDLRSNAGGLLEQALGVADSFLSGGEIVSTRGRDGARARRFSADSDDLSRGLPLAVLIDEGSASAAEIVSGALQDHGRALVLGARSFGKGSVQTIAPVSGGGAVRLTTALYYTPSGRSIQATGIVPDVLVDDGADRAMRESDLDNALPGGSRESMAGARELAEACPGAAEAEDPALACALSLLERGEARPAARG